jgi:hypothetical protein
METKESDFFIDKMILKYQSLSKIISVRLKYIFAHK